MTSLITNLAFVIHIAGGTVGLISGLVAVATRKGGRVHRMAGTIFFGAMLTMAVLADYLAVVRPGQIPNLIIGTFTLYLIVTAWLTVRRPEGQVGLTEKLAMAAALCLLAPFTLLSFDLATGLPPPFKSATPLKGAVMIAIYSFTTVLLVAAVSDARVLLAGGLSGARRIARHLWRMCLGLTLAAGSAFTNGLPRLLPKSVHLPDAVLFGPQLACLAILAFWMIRVRFTPWYRQHNARTSLDAVSLPAGG
ncbi:MAG TPA: DUF2306 domain-containing protein [Caulobacteraceae bacterium]|jgi:uncharacterized membrane protein|nr:DUF2306 domain-containing protein [Caulobacteraceae bacterium]